MFTLMKVRMMFLCVGYLIVVDFLVKSENDEYMYDVIYIVNGRENNVRERFIKLHIEDAGPRHRSGRCKYSIF
jgi:hypothetical protein